MFESTLYVLMKDPHDVFMLPKFGETYLKFNDRWSHIGSLLSEPSPIILDDILLIQQYKQNPNLKGLRTRILAKLLSI